MINRYLRLAVSSCCLLRSTVHWSKPSTPSKVNESQIIVYSNRIQQGTRLKYSKNDLFLYTHSDRGHLPLTPWRLHNQPTAMATMLTRLAQWSINSGCRCGWNRLERCLFRLQTARRKAYPVVPRVPQCLRLWGAWMLRNWRRRLGRWFKVGPSGFGPRLRPKGSGRNGLGTG